MRFRVPCYRIVVLCLLSGIIVAFVNVVLWVPQPQRCVCDCSEAVARKEAELRLHYEYEMALNKGKGAGDFEAENGDNGKELLAASQVPKEDSDAPNKNGEEMGQGDGETGQSSHQLAVIVPFRNRFEEMQEFVPHIHHFLDRQNVRHEIWIINQEDTHRFNRASLLNIGFLMSRRSCDYMVMHDVDLLPTNDDLKYSYPSSGPYHISSPSLHPLYHYKTFVGGILSLTREQFERVNGLSNLFWGWGREDDELYVRMKEAGMTVHYPQGITTGYKTFRHVHDKKKRPRDQKRYHNQWDMSRKRDRATGLDTIQYEVLSHHNMTIDGAPFHFVSVELECDYDVTPFCDDPPS